MVTIQRRQGLLLHRWEPFDWSRVSTNRSIDDLARQRVVVARLWFSGLLYSAGLAPYENKSACLRVAPIA
jgi:hypothetical protein